MDAPRSESAVSSTADREIVIARKVQAPASAVWKAWTTPEQLDKWWGPNGFTNKTISMNLKVGGEWKYTMTAPDGTVFPNLITYRELSPTERMLYDHGDWKNPKLFEAIITFEEMDGATLITMRSTFPTKEARDLVVKEFSAIEGGKQTLTRLAEYLKTL